MESVRIEVGDCLGVLAGLPDCSVQCCVTSPPYYGLRDYGTAKWEGGDDGCDHLKPAAHGYAPFETSTLGPNHDGVSPDNSAHANGTKRQQFSATCGKCGARRIDAQLGLEATPETYVEKMVEVFREVRRVLKDNGILFLNIGDSYCSQGGPEPAQTKWQVEGASDGQNGGKSRKIVDSIKPKNLYMIPARVAIALQADGWNIRSEIIWHKVAPMPESVTDRPTRAHEMLYMLTKSSRYYYNSSEARDPLKPSSVARLGQDIELQEGSSRANGGAKTNGKMKACAPACFGGSRKSEINDQTRLASGNEWNQDVAAGANWRDVWSIAHEGYDGGHFATMPKMMVKRCVIAGSRLGDTILDPFAGSGTSGMVALEYGRSAILIELNPKYAEMCKARCEITQSFI